MSLKRNPVPSLTDEQFYRLEAIADAIVDAGDRLAIDRSRASIRVARERLTILLAELATFEDAKPDRARFAEYIRAWRP